MDVDLNNNDNKYYSYWNVVSRGVDRILKATPGIRMSFEELYTAVYKNVCEDFSEKMHKDLLAQCSQHLEEVKKTLYRYRLECEQRVDYKTAYVLFFHQTMESYLLAEQQIIKIFAYMNKFYVELTLDTSLHAQLLDLFRQRIGDSQLDIIMAYAGDLLNQPFALPPAVFASLFTDLYRIGKRDYSDRYPHLFSRYVTGVLPPMRISDLEAHIAELQAFQERLRAQMGQVIFIERGQKRPGDDDNYGPSEDTAR